MPAHCRVAFLVVALLSELFFPLEAAADDSGPRKEITVVFRFDDYSTRSTTELEVKLIKAFQRHNIRATFGVIPYVSVGDARDPLPQDLLALTPEKAAILRDAISSGAVDVALHGYSHQVPRKVSIEQLTEFRDVDYRTQLKKIQKGRAYLESILGIPVASFIPPWNTYDLNTLRALEALDFKIISAALQGVARPTSSLAFLPATVPPTGLRAAIALARRGPGTDPLIVVLFHEYDFVEINAARGTLAFREFDELLEWVTSQPDVIVRSVGDAAESHGSASVSRFLSNRALHYYHNVYAPPFLRRESLGVGKVHLSSTVAHRAKNEWGMLLLLFYVGVFVLSAAITMAVCGYAFRLFGRAPAICRLAIPVLLVVASVYALHDLKIYYKGIMSMAALLGGSLGVWLAPATRKKHLG